MEGGVRSNFVYWVIKRIMLVRGSGSRMPMTNSRYLINLNIRYTPGPNFLN